MSVLQQHHGASQVGHLSVTKILELLTKSLLLSVSASSSSTPPSLFTMKSWLLSSVPTSPWKGLSCDFVMDLLISNGHDSILVFVDRMTKMSHFSPVLHFQFSQFPSVLCFHGDCSLFNQLKDCPVSRLSRFPIFRSSLLLSVPKRTL